jgi:hypothetical protein
VGADRRQSHGQVCCRSAQRTAPELFLFDQFQFALPLDWNAIILLRKVGIGPVGARPLDKRELPP